MSTFNPGDVVRLKSGGPKMTVRNKTAQGAQSGVLFTSAVSSQCPPTYGKPVTCDWFGEPPGQSVSHFSETFEEEQLTAEG